MSNTLIERLRKYAENDCEGIVMINGNEHGTLLQREAWDLIAEIERDYIPKSDHEKAINAMVQPPNGTYELEFQWAKLILKKYAMSNGVPFGDCKTINEWLERWFIKRHMPKVSDVDGIDIEIGETVWRVCDGKRFKVEDIDEIGGMILVKLRSTEYNFTCSLIPDEITHREPDSLEKLRDDVRDFLDCSIKDDVKSSAYMVEVKDRLTALIERGA